MIHSYFYKFSKKVVSHFIEIQGQFDNHTLLIEKNHIDLLDKYYVNDKLKEKVLILGKIISLTKIN